MGCCCLLKIAVQEGYTYGLLLSTEDNSAGMVHTWGSLEWQEGVSGSSMDSQKAP